MIVIRDLLDAERLATVRSALASAASYDGRRTAGFAARAVKDNLQFSAEVPAIADAARLVLEALRGNDLVRLVARPRVFSAVLFNAYDPGMRYGTHVDDALMRGPPALRSDLSYTVFLEPPDAYDGGELVIESTAGENAIKLPAGSAVIYPSTRLHRVETVTRGRRLAAVGWIQSMVRDAARREILFDLATARRTLHERHGPSRELDLLHKSIANLLRLWSEA